MLSSLSPFVLANVFEPRGWISWIIIGLIAGFLAGKIMRGAGYGIIGDIVVGLVGALIGGFIVRLIWPDADVGFFGSLIISLIGACLFVWLLRMFSGGRKAT
jgi:uncharacterized membrane protein YeaQ/YmgE (transglycosylase-associated protein family)